MQRKWLITAAAARSDRTALFLFNDDILRLTRTGTAAFLRGEPNALGVRVRPTPGESWTDAEFDQASAYIDEDLAEAASWIKLCDGFGKLRRVVIPAQGLGIDALRGAPRIFAHLYYKIVDMEREFGLDQLESDLLFETTSDGLAVPIRRTSLIVPIAADTVSPG